MDVIRVKLDMRRSNPVSSELVWMAVVPSEVTTVKQLAKLLKQRFLLVGRHKLYLDGAWLPPVESIRVLRDNDLLRCYLPHALSFDLLSVASINAFLFCRLGISARH